MESRTTRGIILSLCVFGLIAVFAFVLTLQAPTGALTLHTDSQNNPLISSQPTSLQIRSTIKDAEKPVAPLQLTQDPRALSKNKDLDFRHSQDSKFASHGTNYSKPIHKNQISNDLPLKSMSPQSESSGAVINQQSTLVLSEVVNVPVGGTVPAALAQVDGKSNLDVVSQTEVQAIADSFFQAVDAETQAGVSPEIAWRKQQQLADELFRARYGWEAFIAESARANKEARAQ